MPKQPNADVMFDGPVVHHFDQPGWRGWRPGAKEMAVKPWDILAAQSLLDQIELVTGGGGANGSSGYVRQIGNDSDEFYCESTPTWWIPGRYYDLRDSWCTFYLKELEPITVAPGYNPCMFIAAYMPEGLPRENHRLSCWYMPPTLKVGKGEWAYNEVKLANDPSKWVQYGRNNPPEDTLDTTLAHCGFIGWMYMTDADVPHPYTGVHATGVIGFDEMCFNLKDSDLADLKAGRPLKRALVL